MRRREPIWPSPPPAPRARCWPALHPEHTARFDARLVADLAQADGRVSEVSAGAALGQGRRGPGARRCARTTSGLAETQPAGTGPGQFRAGWSGTQFRALAPFGIADATAYAGAGPPGAGQPGLRRGLRRGEAAGQRRHRRSREAGTVRVLEPGRGHQPAARTPGCRSPSSSPAPIRCPCPRPPGCSPCWRWRWRTRWPPPT